MRRRPRRIQDSQPLTSPYNGPIVIEDSPRGFRMLIQSPEEFGKRALALLVGISRFDDEAFRDLRDDSGRS
jgi:hypothetical protein